MTIEETAKRFTPCADCTFANTDGEAGLPASAQVAVSLRRMFALLFPGCHGKGPVRHGDCAQHVERQFVQIAGELETQIRQSLRHQYVERGERDNEACAARAKVLTELFMAELPAVRELLHEDVDAAYEGDPAATSRMEVVLAYPGLRAITTHRLAHALYRLEVPILPRVMSEIAHSETGIDIHPGAEIGPHFFIDHGTGVVIGETTVIGRNVKLYQGVTLGALSFPKDEKTGMLMKGHKRHPNVEDNVVIYAGATILGGDTTIGHDSEIGGNVWLMDSVPPFSRVYNATPAPKIRPKKEEKAS